MIILCFLIFNSPLQAVELSIDTNNTYLLAKSGETPRMLRKPVKKAACSG